MVKRILTAALLALAAPAAAQDISTGAAPALRVTLGTPDGPVIFATDGGETGTACRAGPGNEVRLYFTFTDPQGVDYAGVDLRADSVRPIVSERTETTLFIAEGNRPERAYRYRYEAVGGTVRAIETLPVAIEVIPQVGPLDIHIEAKDAADHLTVFDFVIPAETVLCS